jgi:DsbC/DsbD-like thiol-disulfide interchange protein
MTRRALSLAVAFAGVSAAAATGQTARPRAEVTPIVVSTPARAGETARLSLRVRLPADVHVQAHEPRDPSLIPTVLTVEAPPGIAVEAVEYPPPTELTQTGRTESLAVLGPEFVIDVRVSIAPTVGAGELVLPAVLRYQACNDALCFPPARAPVTWRVPVISAR